MNWTELQDHIAQRYCGTVLVLDDEIHKLSDKGEVILHPLFLETKAGFEAEGMLCDLRQIGDDFDDNTKVELIEQQLSRCDTVVLDWYLGTGRDRRGDSSNAIRVLKKMASLGGFRFAVIHSKERDEAIVDKLKSTFESKFDVVTPNVAPLVADSDSTQVISEDEPSETLVESQTAPAAYPTTYRLEHALYVSIVGKERSPLSFVDMPSCFRSGLKSAYPDHLHWVGFDFASRVRELLPQLLESLPKGTDIALIFQALLQGDGELGDSLAEAFAEEIAEMLRGKPLLASTDKTLIERVIGGSKTTPHGQLKSTTADFIHALEPSEHNHSAFEELFGSVVAATGEDKKKAALRCLCESISNSLAGSTQGLQIVAAHEGYASLREHFQTKSHPSRLYPGVVLRASNPSNRAGKQEWLLCLSPACDCARGDDKKDYLFVKGKTVVDVERDSETSVHTCIATDGSYKHVQWSSKWFITMKTKPSVVDGYTFHTRLRDDFVRLLTQKVFGWQSRAGVNSSEYLRIMRNRP